MAVEAGGGRRRRTPGRQDQKQEPHTKLWGINISNSDPRTQRQASHAAQEFWRSCERLSLRPDRRIVPIPCFHLQMLVCDLGFSVTNASRFCSLHAETQTKLCGPGMKPFQLSKNPIQVNLFRQSYVVAFEIFTAGCDMLVIYYPPTPADSKGDTPGSKSFFGNNNQKKQQVMTSNVSVQEIAVVDPVRENGRKMPRIWQV